MRCGSASLPGCGKGSETSFDKRANWRVRTQRKATSSLIRAGFPNNQIDVTVPVLPARNSIYGAGERSPLLGLPPHAWMVYITVTVATTVRTQNRVLKIVANQQKQNRLLLGGRWTDSGLVFTMENGEPRRDSRRNAKSWRVGHVHRRSTSSAASGAVYPGSTAQG